MKYFIVLFKLVIPITFLLRFFFSLFNWEVNYYYNNQLNSTILNGFPLPDNGEFYHSSVGGTTQWFHHLINVLICFLVACLISYYLEKRINNKSQNPTILILIISIYVIGIPGLMIDYFGMIFSEADAWPEKVIIKNLRVSVF